MADEPAPPNPDPSTTMGKVALILRNLHERVSALESHAERTDKDVDKLLDWLAKL